MSFDYSFSKQQKTVGETKKHNVCILALTIVLFTPCTLLLANHTGSSADPPNILLINIDDLGWTDLGYAGSLYYETPHLDQLASEGMIFSQAYASASNCAPSRAALFTGQYAPRTGVYTVENSDRGPSVRRKLIPTENTLFISNETLTIADVLQQNGYHTAHVGKWHISKDPAQNGFEVNAGGFEAGNPAGWGMGGYFAPYNNPHLEEGPEGEYLTDRLTDEAIAFLESVDDQPFFLNYAPYIVHTPIQPKAALEKEYQDKNNNEQHHHAGYAAMVETMDHNVGRLINHLKQTGKYENTFILFTSDNGGLYPISKQWPLRAGKGSYFEGGIRVPMIVVWAGEVLPGSTTNQSVTNIDFFPTMLEVVGIEKPEDKVLDGMSLLPVLQGERLDERPLFWHFPVYLQAYRQNEGMPETHDPHFRTRPGSVVKLGPWKLHEYFEDGRLELYHLDIDVGEKKNLVDVFPEKAEQLHEMLLAWRKKTGAPVPQQLNPEYEENLK